MAISIQNLYKTYHEDTPVLSDFSLQVQKGEFLCILGPSGCGKSTLLRLIAGLEKPTGGSIETDSPGTKQPIAYVFQHPNLLPWRSVEQNIGMPLELNRDPKKAIKKAVSESLVQVGLKPENANKLPGMLSGGMQMRASLARAMITGAKILLLDEPFGALDEVLRHRLNEELFLWSKQNDWTVIFVTHSVSEAAFLGTRIIMMGQNGKIVFRKDSPFQFDRKNDLRNSPEFHKLSAELSAKLRELTPEIDG